MLRSGSRVEKMFPVISRNSTMLTFALISATGKVSLYFETFLPGGKYIMSTDWTNLGESLLGKDKQGWSTKFNILSKVRNPLAHNRSESVADGERKQAEGICREILNRYCDYAKTDFPA